MDQMPHLLTPAEINAAAIAKIGMFRGTAATSDALRWARHLRVARCWSMPLDHPVGPLGTEPLADTPDGLSRKLVQLLLHVGVPVDVHRFGWHDQTDEELKEEFLRGVVVVEG
jgi:hypothetical protein